MHKFPLFLLLTVAVAFPISSHGHQAAGHSSRGHQAAEHSTGAAGAYAPQTAAMWKEGPPVAARFGVSISRDGSRPVAQEDWYLLRDLQRIERVRPDAGLAEIWERDDRGEVSLKRVFGNDSRIVEYVPGELRARQMDVPWESLGSVVDPRFFATLKRTRTVNTRYGRASVLRGSIAGERIELWWLDALALPARVIKQQQNVRVTINLKTLHFTTPENWPRADMMEGRIFETIDVADLGDRHYDPFVHKVESLDAVLQGVASPRR
ncbi:hypothetical protein SAMN05216299_11335 [Nitrosospira sp. Nsp14]|nr:hypothetical protein SAMN05216299_11335 [Nitrosospira sp. Nsp14]